jgi:hypothetical protein
VETGTVAALGLIIAVAGLTLSLLNSAVQLQAYRRDRAAVTIRISETIGPGRATPDGVVGPRIGPAIQYLSVVATNSGRQPVGITSIALLATPAWHARYPRRWRRIRLAGLEIPLRPATGYHLPATLQPAEHLVAFVELEVADARIRLEHAHGARVVAYSPDGRVWRRALPSYLSLRVGQPYGYKPIGTYRVRRWK